jgi:preprotein translocase subunit SecA
LEAKEGVSVQNENQTLASVTYQNYFRMYPKLAGMTGTAMTEEEEFGAIYGLEVVDVPPNRPKARIDEHDEVYRTAEEKNAAIIDLVEAAHKRQQPVLVGTVSIEKSEQLADLLRKKKKINPAVLNAKYHEQEAYIIAQAGVPGAVTIATNMAGRGTDIQLGGNAEYRITGEEKTLGRELTDAEKDALRADVAAKKEIALAAGGLYVVGTERHESRRIDNQLRGRSGRQGDPGASKFFLSLQDDLMRIFGSERMDGMLQRLGLEKGEAIIHPWINRAIEKAQQKVEARNFDIRKNLLQFDDVMNDQRRVVFSQRREIMNSNEIEQLVVDMRHEVIADLVARFIPARAMREEWDKAGLHEEALRLLDLDLPFTTWAEEEGIAEEEIRERVTTASDAMMAERAKGVGPDVMRRVEKSLVLQMIDQGWRDHLAQLDTLRHGVNLRAYGQKQPLLEYQREAFGMMQEMLAGLRERVTSILSRVVVRDEPAPQDLTPPPRRMVEERPPEPQTSPAAAAPAMPPQMPTVVSNVPAAERNPGDPSTWGRVGRNETCPCGSGRKYKHCHGVPDRQAMA